MSLPSELVIENAISSIGDLIVYQAEHPIHGEVRVYKPDTNLPPDIARTVRRRLYENGLKMREVSLSNPRFVTKALEVSQNPNEPYVVTEHAEHDLEELIGNGVTIKPKRMFEILTQILNAIEDSEANGWAVGNILPRQIKLPKPDEGDIGFSLIEGPQDDAVAYHRGDGPQNSGATGISTMTVALGDTPPHNTLGEENDAARPTGQDQPLKGQATSEAAKAAAAVGEHAPNKDTEQQLWTVQKNIYTLGSITYQLLFGRKYEASDDLTSANIERLAARWRRILAKALSDDIDRRYATYESMLRDIHKSAARNRRMAVASTPFLLILIAIASYLGYEKYREHKIMTSDTGQAIESFLEIITETQDEIPELERPQPKPPTPDDKAILTPFEEIADPNRL